MLTFSLFDRLIWIQLFHCILIQLWKRIYQLKRKHFSEFRGAGGGRGRIQRHLSASFSAPKEWRNFAENCLQRRFLRSSRSEGSEGSRDVFVKMVAIDRNPLGSQASDVNWMMEREFNAGVSKNASPLRVARAIYRRKEQPRTANPPPPQRFNKIVIYYLIINLIWLFNY